MTIFLDCSYTRTQQGSVGITRAVRNLAQQLPEIMAAGEKLVLVVAGSDGFRVVPAAADASTAPDGPYGQAAPFAVRLYRRLMAARIRAAVARTLPLALQVVLWRLYSRLTFSHLSRDLPHATIGAGDLVLLCDASWSYDVGRCARKAIRQGAKIVTLIYDLIPINHPQYCAPLFTAVFRRWINEIVLFSDGIICISAATEREVGQYCRDVAGRAVPLDHFQLGSDLEAGAARGSVRPEIERLCDGAGREKLFLAVGSIEPRKNYALLMDSFESVWASDPQASLTVVGRASADAGPVLARMHRHPMMGRRLFVYLDANDAELDRLYCHARALVFPSAAEGFGLPLVEARQRGCLVLASDIPVFRELADGGVRLFPVDSPAHLSQAILDVLASPPLRPAARPLFGWRASAEEFLRKVRRLAGAAR